MTDELAQPTDTETPRLTAHSVGDLLDVIPTLLGFHPTESLVAVLADRGRVKVTARVDLADALQADRMDGVIDPLLSRFPTADWVLAAYTPDAEVAWASLDLTEAMLPWGVTLAAVHVAPDRWFCEPGDVGVAYDPGCSVLAAEAAYQGLRVLADRSELAGSLEAVVPPEAMQDALERLIALAPEQAVARALRVATEKMRGGGRPSVDEAALLAVAAFSPDFAETIITGIDTRTVAQARALWIEVVRATSPHVGAAAALILGVAAWVGGEGALQNVCVERAAPFLDDSPWLDLLDFVNRTALPPSEWTRVRRDLLRGRGAA